MTPRTTEGRRKGNLGEDGNTMPRAGESGDTRSCYILDGASYRGIAAAKCMHAALWGRADDGLYQNTAYMMVEVHERSAFGIGWCASEI